MPARVPVAPKPVALVEAADAPPRPVEVPWAAAPEPQSLAATAATTDDGADEETELPARLPGRVRTLAAGAQLGSGSGFHPGPCCLRNPQRCAEFVASTKIEGTLASRAVQSLKLRAAPFGKPPH
jgi:hypothetical protein